jgi:hypothetical protein
MITSAVGVFHCGDVELTPTSGRQRLHDSPVALTDPTYAYWWAADSALDRAEEDGIARDVWLIIGGVVTDHAHIR